MSLIKGFLATILFLSAVNISQHQELSIPFYGLYDGFDTRPGQFPYHAYIGCKLDDETIGWKCNGAVVSRRFVITTAKCAQMGRFCNNSFVITVGSIAHPGTNATEDEHFFYVTKPGSKPHYPPDFIEDNEEDSLALLETSTPIIFNKAVAPVIIPKQNQITLAANTELVATGFGRSNHSLNPWWELQFLTLEVSPKAECLEYFANSFQTMCARDIEFNRMVRGTLCREHSSPIVLKRDNRTLVGIYQSSMPSCEVGGPEEFLPIESYITWIYETARLGRNSTQ